MSIFNRKQKRTGALDGGEGRGVRLGGRDYNEKPTGYHSVDTADDEEIVNDSATLDDYEALVDSDDAPPGDRRRDPLRR